MSPFVKAILHQCYNFVTSYILVGCSFKYVFEKTESVSSQNALEREHEVQTDEGLKRHGWQKWKIHRKFCGLIRLAFDC